jgi:hypothetical protein
MDIVSPLVTKAISYWKVIAAVLVSAIIGYFVYRRFWGSKGVQGFTTMGGECDPQIENSCGNGAICQSDDTGSKGVCFPLPEEEGVEAKQEVVDIAAAQQEEETEQPAGESQGEEESSS